MNDPPFDDEIEALLRAERGRPPPDAAMQARVLSRLSATLGPLDGGGGGGGGHGSGGPSPAGVGQAPATVGTAAGSGWMLGVKPAVLALTFALGGVTGALIHRAATPTAAPPPVLVEERREPLPEPPAPSVAPVVTTPPPVASIPAPAAASVARDTHDTHDAKDVGARDLDLAGERALIEMARSAMARGQGDAAITALKRHAARYPRGQLAEEREGLLVHALAASGDTAAAREKAATFRKQFPGSLQTPAVDGALDGGAP